MFSRNVLHVEVLSLELCEKTEKWAESVRAKNIEDDQQLVKEGREILDCGISLLQVGIHFHLLLI